MNVPSDGYAISLYQYDKNGNIIDEKHVERGTNIEVLTLNETTEVLIGGTGSYADAKMMDGNICTIKDDSKYNINLITSGGTINSGNVTSFVSGQLPTIALPTDVTRDGYIFDGWYDNPEFNGSAYTSLDYHSFGMKSDDLTFYAKWI